MTATFVHPSCDHKTSQVAVGGTKEVERLPWYWIPWSPWSFESVQNSRTNVAEEVDCSQVAQTRQGGCTCIAVVAEWMHNGGILVVPKNLYCCKSYVSIWAMLLPPLHHHLASFGRPIESIWPITVATTVTPFSNPWTTMAMVRPPLCLLWATCASTAVLLVQRNHQSRATAVTQKQNFLS